MKYIRQAIENDGIYSSISEILSRDEACNEISFQINPVWYLFYLNSFLIDIKSSQFPSLGGRRSFYFPFKSYKVDALWQSELLINDINYRPPINIDALRGFRPNVEDQARIYSELENIDLFDLSKPLILYISFDSWTNRESIISNIRSLIADSSNIAGVIFEIKRDGVLLSDNQNTIVKSGASVGGAKSSGTFGGAVIGDTESVFGMTCGHIFETEKHAYCPALFDNPTKPIKLGEVAHLVNPIADNSKSFGKVTTFNTLDVCLFLISHSLSQRSINNNGVSLKISSDFAPYDTIRINGRTSGQKTLKVAKYVHKKRFNSSKSAQFIWFTDLYSVQNVNSNMFSRLKRPIQSGDSGSWVISNTNNDDEFYGMIIAADDYEGYFTPAETIDSWMKNNKIGNYTPRYVKQTNIVSKDKGIIGKIAAIFRNILKING